jgi:hypothetical protein
MITVDRFFPIPGVTVADQQYNVNTTPPDGYYAPSSTTGDPMNLECYLHDETSIPEPEPDPEPEEEEPIGSETNSPGNTTEQPPDEPAQPETPQDTDTQD